MKPLKAVAAAFLSHGVPIACWLHEMFMVGNGI